MGKNGKKKFRPFAVQVGNTVDLSSIPNDSNEERSSYSSANNRRQNQRDRPDLDEERASRGPWRTEPVSRNSDSFVPSVEGSTWRQPRNERPFRGDPNSRRGYDREYNRDSLKEENNGEIVRGTISQQEKSRGDNSSNLENESNEGEGEDTHSSVSEQAQPTVNSSWYEDSTSNDTEVANSRQNRQEAHREVPDRSTQKYVPPRSSYNSQNYNGPPSRTDGYQRQRRYDDNDGNERTTWRNPGGSRGDSNTRDYRSNYNNRGDSNREGERREGPQRSFPSAWNKNEQYSKNRDNSETSETFGNWRQGPNSRPSPKDVRSVDSSRNADRSVNSNDSLENEDRKRSPRNSSGNEDMTVNPGNESEDVEVSLGNTSESATSDWNKQKRMNSRFSSEKRGNTKFSPDKDDKRESFRRGRSIFLGSPSEEQESFISFLHSKDAANFTKVKEEEQDLFSVGDDYALAHCVAEDMNMGSGIAVEFRVQFKKVADLLDQRAVSGGLAFLEINGRFIYYLVTKTLSRGKPTYDTLWSSLLKLRTHMKNNNVTKLALPRIGCGLDRLDWDHVKPMIEFLFRNEEVDILVCNFQPDGLNNKTLKKCKVVLEQKPVTEIDPETVIIYFASKDGKITENMRKLDDKFKFLAHFEKESKDLGKPVRLVPMFAKKYILYGCIVKDKYEDPFSFVAFASCLHAIVKNYKIDNFFYIAFQSEEDDLLNTKILNLMKHTLKDMDIYICGYSETPSSVEE